MVGGSWQWRTSGIDQRRHGGRRFGDAGSPGLEDSAAQRRGSSPQTGTPARSRRFPFMIRKLKSGQYRLYSRKKDPSTGKRRNLGTFDTRAGAEKHERDVHYFKRH
jgi:hypothetical protein